MPSRKDRANAIRALSMDAVQKAKSGHPGAPMGMADIAEVLWHDFLQHNPANPQWPDRDRFVLSNGHGSMLLYSLLHLSGYDLGLDDLKNFRQLDSRTPGHPEHGYAPGVETTTGPLGQGIANAVGMAIAERTLAAQFNREGHTVVDHRTYVFCGDGCLMEGISHEVCSLAGTLGLGKLICFYDDNGISIDGEVEGWFTDDTPARFESYNWQVIRGIDGHDADAIKGAIEEARANTSQPTLICCRTIIGFGAPNKQGTESCHGAPLGEEEIAGARQALGWPHDPFDIPAAISDCWNARESGAEREATWKRGLDRYRAAFPELAAELERRLSGVAPAGFDALAKAYVAECQASQSTVASRKASQQALNALAPGMPELIGGSADLAGSNLTLWSGSKGIQDDPAGNYIFYGVREFGMSAIANGIALHGGFQPYVATFLVFMDYARNAVRMSSIMKQPCVYVFTHDSIGLGEDGPTHQPVEHLTSLRTLPNMRVWRPADVVETAAAWHDALTDRRGPVSMILSRQNLPHQPRTDAQVADIYRGAYVLKDCLGTPACILLATGSEVGLVMSAAEVLSEEGVAVRVVSMPCAEIFEQQDDAYRESVLPAGVVARLAVEAAHQDYWRKYVGLGGRVLGMTGFGESAPAEALFKLYGFTTENVCNIVREMLA